MEDFILKLGLQKILISLGIISILMFVLGRVSVDVSINIEKVCNPASLCKIVSEEKDFYKTALQESKKNLENEKNKIKDEIRKSESSNCNDRITDIVSKDLCLEVNCEICEMLK